MRLMIVTWLLVALVAPTSAWVQQPTFSRQQATISRSRSTTITYNVPPPSEQNVAEFTEYASKLSPPSSFFELQQDSVRAARLAIQDGHRLLEIEFPPLPASVLEQTDVSAYDLALANLQLSLDFAKGLLASCDNVKKIALMAPDPAEQEFFVGKAGSANPYPGIIISSLRRPKEDANGTPDTNKNGFFQPEQVLLNIFGGASGGRLVQPIDGVDVYIILTVSAQELPDVEELHNAAVNNATIICYNLKLDVLRGDLGTPAFPPRAFQDRFLSRVKPVYYLRTRQYSRSTSTPPFLVNFQGCLFRAYPGEYQTLLDTGNGRYRRLLSSPIRPALGEFKEQLTDELKNQGILPEEGTTLSFLRTGYKTTTWWEEDREDASDAWKT